MIELTFKIRHKYWFFQILVDVCQFFQLIQWAWVAWTARASTRFGRNAASVNTWFFSFCQFWQFFCSFFLFHNFVNLFVSKKCLFFLLIQSRAAVLSRMLTVRFYSVHAFINFRGWQTSGEAFALSLILFHKVKFKIVSNIVVLSLLILQR